MLKIKGNRPRVIAIHNSTGSRVYRLLPQVKHLASLGWDIKVRGLKAGAKGGIEAEMLEWADIVVTEMTYSPLFIKTIKKLGAKVVYELDDLMEKVTKLHPAYPEMNWWRTYMTYKCLTMTDAITTTVLPLKEHYKWFSDNIHVLPNYLDLDFWEKPYLPNTSNTIRIGWIGGTSHKEDLMFLAPVLEKLLKKYKNTKFICVGFGGTSSENEWVEFQYGEHMFKGLPKEQYEYSLGAPVEVFPSKIPAMRLDIGVAPVVNNVFAKCKSNCKAQEYGINRIPGVYTKFLYKDAVIDGKTGFLAETQDEWYEKLATLIEMKQKDRREMGENAYEHIKKNFNFKDHAHKWVNLYESLLCH